MDDTLLLVSTYLHSKSQSSTTSESTRLAITNLLHSFSGDGSLGTTISTPIYTQSHSKSNNNDIYGNIDQLISLNSPQNRNSTINDIIMNGIVPTPQHLESILNYHLVGGSSSTTNSTNDDNTKLPPTLPTPTPSPPPPSLLSPLPLGSISDRRETWRIGRDAWESKERVKDVERRLRFREGRIRDEFERERR